MPKYSFVAVDFQNNKVRGVADAKDGDDLRKLLRGKNLVPVSYKTVDERNVGRRFRANELAEFTRQLSSMLGSGITLVRAMEILKDRDFQKPIKSAYEKLHKDVQLGQTLSEAMKLQSKVFPELLINMVASGEVSGQLEQVTGKMAVHYEKEHKLNGKVKTAMTYPSILLTVTFIVVMLLFTVILPQFFEIFEGVELPALTQVMIGVSGFLRVYWHFLLVALALLAAGLRYFLSVRGVRIQFDKLKLRLPVIGKLLKVIYTARFSRTLSSLYSSGIAMITALEISSTIIGNKYIEDQFSGVIKNVRNGDPLSASLGAVDGFDKKMATSIMIGEEAGRLDTMLQATADSFDYEAETATGRLVQFVEPVMIVIIAVIVGLVMISVMSPIITMQDNVQYL